VLVALLLSEVASATTAKPQPSLWQQERDKHGWESMVQLFGHLAADAKLVEPEGDKFPYVQARIAVNRGEDMDASFITFYVRGVKENSTADDSTRPTSEELAELVSHLKRGQRVKLQGKVDIRPVRQDLYKQLIERLGISEEQAKSDPVAKEFFFSSSASVTLFINREQLDLQATYNDASARRPITLLPNIGEESGRENPKTPF